MKANVNLMYKNTAQTSENIHKTTKKRVRTRRFLSLFLTLSIVASFFVLPQIPASAAFGGGSGTLSDPYLITGYSDLNLLATNVNAGVTYKNQYFKQTANITLDSSYKPIGSLIKPFSGYYNGDGYLIKLNNHVFSESYNGVFGCISSGQVYNVYTSGSATFSAGQAGGAVCGALTGRSYIYQCKNEASLTAGGCVSLGGIAGMLESSCSGGEIEYCENTGNITQSVSDGGYVGGILGMDASPTSVMVYLTRCQNSGRVVSASDFTGGIAGSMNSGSIGFCRNTGAINGGSMYTGGIAGSISGSCYITNTFNTGTVQGESRTGGICGQFGNCTALYPIQDSYNAETVRGTTYVGGLVGYDNSAQEIIILRSHNAGNVNTTVSAGSTSYVGSLVGYSRNINYSSSYWKSGTANVAYNGSYKRSLPTMVAAAGYNNMSNFSGLGSDWCMSNSTIGSGHPNIKSNGECDYGSLSGAALNTGLSYNGLSQKLLKSEGTGYVGPSAYNTGSYTVEFAINDCQKWSSYSGLEEQMGPGTYSVYYRLSSQSTYNDYLGWTMPKKLGTVTIDKSQLNVSFTLSETSKEYTGKEHTIGVTPTDYPPPTSIAKIYFYATTSTITPSKEQIKSGSGRATVKDVGSYKYYCYAESVDEHYKDSKVFYIGTYTITAGTPEVSASVNSSALSYNGSAQQLLGTTSVSSGATLYYYCSTSSTTPTASASGWTTTKPAQTNAGTYYMWYKVVGGSNWNDIGVTYIGSKSIGKGNNSITLANTTIERELKATEAENTFSLGATVSNGNTPTYTSNNPAVVRINSDGTATALKPGQATITVSYAGDSNENPAESKQIYVDISGRGPGKVASFTATSGQNGKITLNWTAPTFTGGSPITNYIIKRKAEGEENFTSISRTFTAADFSYTDTDVVNGKTYEYQILAQSALGISVADEDIATASAKPSVPSGPVRNAKASVMKAPQGYEDYAQSILFEFEAPENDGGDTPSDYKIKLYSDEACENACDGSLPGDPERNDTGSSEIISYTITQSNRFGKGQQLYAKITPVNGSGDGESVVVPFKWLYSDVDAPADFRLVPTGDGEITAYWADPENTGYGPVKKSTLSYRKHGSGDEFTVVELTDMDSIRDMVEEGSESVIGKNKYKYVITGLETGSDYDVKISISNAIYTGNETAVLVQRCAGRPSVPVIDGDMITKDSGVFVKGASAENNGADITEYVFYARLTEDGAEAPFVEFARVNADKNGKLSNAYAKGDITNGKEYEICVSAVNISGEGAKSEPQTINVGYPSVVQNVHITPQAGSIMHIAFDPADGNGRKIDHYELLIGGTANGKTQPVVTKTIKETSYDYFTDERVNGDEVTVQVVAVTKIGVTQEAKSEPSEKLTARIGAPSTPVLNKFETDTTGVSLAWTDSMANGNAMKYYTVYIADISSPENTTVTRFKTANADAESLEMVVAKGEIDTTDAVETFDNSGERVQLLTKYSYPFVDGHKYSVTVTATNAAGESDASNAGVFTFAAPAEPQDVVVTPEDGKLTVSWSKPLNDGGYKIVGYNIYLNEDKDPTMKVEWVKMVNGVEVGDDDAPAATTAPTPEATVDPEATVAPADEVKYQLMVTDYRKGTDAKPEQYGEGQDNIDKFEVIIDNLANGYSYTATVKAINESGEGAGSNNTEPEIPRTKASAPLNIEGQGASGTSVDISWRKPVSDGGTPINGYNVRAYAVSKKNMETGEYENITPETDNEGNKIAAAEMTNVIGTSCTVKGLKTEYGYVFEVCAVTSAGEGAIGTSDVAKTHTKPSKPSIVSLDSGVGSGETLPLTVTWAAPEDDGNSPIIGYDVLVGGFPMNKDGMLSPDELTWTFEDNRVKSGKTYKVTVRAYNAVDVEGVESDPMSIKVGTVPAPKNVQLSGDTDGNIYITWPIDQYKDVMSYIEKYVVYVDGEMFASTANNRDNHMTAELQDLGVKHKVEVAVLSTMGEGNKSVPVYITLGTTDSINNVSAVAGKESIKLTWDKPTVHTNNLNPSSYTVYANGKAVKTISTADLDIVNNKIKTELTDLEGGKEYTITVTATNKYGECEPSEAVKVTPWSDPDTPKVSNIKPALGEFSFTFEDGNGNGAAIADHNIYLDGNKLEASTYTIDGNKVTVKNVTDGGEGHKFYITAVTVVGGGTCESAKPDPEYTVITGVPLVPDNVKAIAGVSEATIAFDKSEDISAEYPVTKYNIYKIENGVETLLASVPSRDENDNVAERYSYTVNDLKNGIDYSFAVSALNDLGESEHCGVSVRPGTPTAPEIESVTPSSGKLEVKWTKPESSNAGAITKYGVYLNGVLAKTTPETSLLIKELENGSEYVITVSAFNYVGEGEKSEAVTATPGGPPDKVQDISYELTYNETDKCGVELTWRAPEDTGGLDVTGYKVIGDGNIVVTGRTAVITGLERGTNYTWDIIACSAAGDGNAVTTDVITTLDKSGAPKLVGVDSSNVEFTITWKAPTNDGNSNITAYNFYFKPVDGGEELVWTPDSIPEADQKGEMSISVNTDMLTELAVGQKYEIAIAAVNAVDESERSESMRVTLNDALEQKKPGAPTNVKASKGDTKITVSWAAPFSDGNSTITSYVIWTGTSEDNMGYLATVDGHTFSYEHTGLQNGTKRFYKVKAVNGVDADGGPFSEIVSETPVKINAPTKPAWVTFNDAEGKSAYETSASGDTMTLRWNESTGDELGGAISYEVYINGTLMDTTDGLEYVLSNPANNTRYNVQIKAVNEVGGETLSDYLYAYKNLNIRKGKAEDGYEYDEYYNDNVFAYIDADYDGEEDYKPSYTKPNPPENVELKQSKTEPSAILTWEPPTETGNKEINGYKAYITFNGETEIVQLDANGNVENNHSLFSLFSTDDTDAQNDSLYEYVFGITYGKAYTVQMKAVNEIGESDPSLPATLYSFPETPSAFKANVENKSDIALEWQLVSEPSSFTLYVNGKPQTEIAMDEVTATKNADSEFTTYKYTYQADLNETYFLEIVANFIGADQNEVPSGRSDGCEISTKEAQANAPTITSAKANGDAVDDMYRVTLEWTAPDNINDADVDADSYVVYVNGQEYTGKFYVDGAEADTIPADATSVDIEGIYNKSLIKIAAVSTSGTVGIVSEPFTFNAVEQTFDVGTPGKPEFTIDDCELVTDNGVLLNENNLVINWKSAAISAEHNVKATGFDIYFGSDYQDTVEADPNDTEDVQYAYTYTLTVEAGLDYNIRIVPIYAETESADEIEGPEASVILEVPGYPEPSKPTLTAELSSDKKTIALTWDANELSGVKYTVTVNGVDVAENIEGTSYTYTVEENVTDYVISVTAVRDYELSDGSIETTTAKSNSEKVTVQNGSGGGETGDGNTNSNPPVITKTLSNGGVGGSGIKVKVYWNAPADKLQDEVGEIYKYVVVADDKAIGTVLVKNDDGTDNQLEYEITTFKTLTETKNVVIRAIKEINGQDVISATSKSWIVSPKYNVQNDPDKYENDDDTDVEHKNTTGEDKEDEEKQQITLPIVANVDGNIKVTIKDNFDKTVEIGAALDENGSGTVNINDADVNDPNKTFSITLSKECCTSYTITGLKYEDLTSSKLEELMNSVELYVGDFNGDGSITINDRAVLNRNMNKTGMTLADGDLNGDGVVTLTDRAMFNKAVNRVSIEIPFSK